MGGGGGGEGSNTQAVINAEVSSLQEDVKYCFMT